MNSTYNSIISTLESLGIKPGCVVINPATDRPQINTISNDVYNAIERLGGIREAARTLKVTEAELNQWIDDHFVPTHYAKKIQSLTGYHVSSLQEAPFYIFDGILFWPHTPQRRRITAEKSTGVNIFPVPDQLWTGVFPRTKFIEQARLVTAPGSV